MGWAGQQALTHICPSTLSLSIRPRPRWPTLAADGSPGVAPSRLILSGGGRADGPAAGMGCRGEDN